MRKIVKEMDSWMELSFLLKLLSFTSVAVVVAIGYISIGFSAIWLLLGLDQSFFVDEYVTTIKATTKTGEASITRFGKR